MKKVFAVCLAAGLLAGCAHSPLSKSGDPVGDAWAAIKNWSPPSWASAANCIEKYGAPDHIDAGRLVWYRRGAWKRVEVWDLAASRDAIEETVAYTVPEGKKAALSSFSDKLYSSQDGAELSVRGASEPENYLTMNLAAEIIRGYTTPEEAKTAYDKTMDLRYSGKSSSMTERLLFPGQESNK